MSGALKAILFQTAGPSVTSTKTMQLRQFSENETEKTEEGSV